MTSPHPRQGAGDDRRAAEHRLHLDEPEGLRRVDARNDKAVERGEEGWHLRRRIERPEEAPALAERLERRQQLRPIRSLARDALVGGGEEDLDLGEPSLQERERSQQHVHAFPAASRAAMPMVGRPPAVGPEEVVPPPELRHRPAVGGWHDHRWRDDFDLLTEAAQQRRAVRIVGGV